MRVPGATAWLAGGGRERGARGGAVQGVACARSTGGAAQFRRDEMRSVAEIFSHHPSRFQRNGACNSRSPSFGRQSRSNPLNLTALEVNAVPTDKETDMSYIVHNTQQIVLGEPANRSNCTNVVYWSS